VDGVLRPRRVEAADALVPAAAPRHFVHVHVYLVSEGACGVARRRRERAGRRASRQVGRQAGRQAREK
jgi:hypothetical protein